jgi:hypothetical protein
MALWHVEEFWFYVSWFFMVGVLVGRFWRFSEYKRSRLDIAMAKYYKD